MKQSLLILLILNLVTLISCNKKELEESNQFIIGTWVVNFETINGCTDTNQNIEHEISCTDSHCIEFTFEEGGIYSANIVTSNGQLGEQGTFTLNVDEISLCQEDEGVVTCKGGSYDISPTTLQFTISDSDSGCSTTWTFEKVESGA